MPNLDGLADTTFNTQTFGDRAVPHAIPLPPPQITGVTTSALPDQVSGGLDLSNERWPAWMRHGAPGSSPTNIAAGAQELSIADQWFEDIYVLPVSIDTGIILTVLFFVVETFNSHRVGSVTWTSYDDSSAGSGVTLQNPPPPPPDIIIPALTGSIHQLEVSPIGPPQISGSLDFQFTDPQLIIRSRSIPIIGQRGVIFPFEPEVPVIEILESITSVIEAADGDEQRSGLREVPRTIMNMKFRTEGDERRRIETILFDRQAGSFGVPAWWRQTEVTSPIAVDDVTISVVDTTFLDLVVGGIAVVRESYDRFEALQIDSFTSTTITFSSPFTLAFSVGVQLMPVLTSVTKQPVGRSRFLRELQDHDIVFDVVDNGPSLADTSAFNSYTPTGGTTRVFLDGPNLMSGDQIAEQIQRKIVVVDNGSAFPIIFTSQDVSRGTMQKGFFSNSASELSDIRNLLHALSGRRVSFYIPTFFPDLEAIASVSSVDQSVTIRDIDYVNLIKQRQARNVIRVVGKNGTVSTPKLVTGSSKPTPGEETISITPDTIGVTIALADIERVEYIQKVRINTDRVQIQHFNSAGKAKVFFPVIAVLEGD